ncbi:hypothetical protein BDR26DRAFT_857304 [Obelidium mucronatum]|nr:hypothetical protein BDR26DRAFT_857304 [Obelidium mucronatum]
MVFYCSYKCQVGHFEFHSRFECKGGEGDSSLAAAVSNTTTTVSPPPPQPAAINMNAYTRSDVQSFARWILNYCIRGELELKYSTVQQMMLVLFTSFQCIKMCWKLVPNLESLTFQHGDKGGNNVYLLFLLFSSQRFTSVEEFLTVMSIRQCNSFGLWDAESESLGQCLFPAASYFNHSCDKNLYFDMNMKVIESGRAVDVNLLPELVWRAKRDIKKGQVLTHSYIDTSMDRESRRKALRDGYHFDCDCDKCEAEANR